MSTLDGPIWSKRSIALTCPPGHISSAHRAREDGARVGMNVTVHQQEENEETKKGKRGAGEKKKRKQATDYKEAVCCPLAVVQGEAYQKMKGSAWGNWDPREGQQPFRPNPNGVGTAPPR